MTAIVCRGCHAHSDSDRGRGLCRRCYYSHYTAGTLDQFPTRLEAPIPTAHDLSWTVDALCAQVDPEIFFPEQGASTTEAKAVCSSCLVRAECLDYALATHQRFGVWGGVSDRSRRALLGLADDSEEAA